MESVSIFTFLVVNWVLPESVYGILVGVDVSELETSFSLELLQLACNRFMFDGVERHLSVHIIRFNDGLTP